MRGNTVEESILGDVLVDITPMQAKEYHHFGQNLVIHYDFSRSSFGPLIIASTHLGICYIAFYDNKNDALDELKSQFPKATYQQKENETLQNVRAFNQKNASNLTSINPRLPINPHLPIKLHLKGTPFQLKVWAELLNIQSGSVSSYGELAFNMGKPKAARAVGSAIGKNLIALLIPCHRVIQGSGNAGQYRWGRERKVALLTWEAERLKAHV